VQQDFNITDSQQFDAPSKKVFMRVHFAGTDVTDLKAAFQETADASSSYFTHKSLEPNLPYWKSTLHSAN
jgi:formyltetrahydrofolate hydrolase